METESKKELHTLDKVRIPKVLPIIIHNGLYYFVKVIYEFRLWCGVRLLFWEMQKWVRQR